MLRTHDTTDVATCTTEQRPRSSADERTRTSTPFRTIDPKSIASTNSATSAYGLTSKHYTRLPKFMQIRDRDCTPDSVTICLIRNLPRNLTSQIAHQVTHQINCVSSSVSRFEILPANWQKIKPWQHVVCRVLLGLAHTAAARSNVLLPKAPDPLTLLSVARSPSQVHYCTCW